MTTVLLIAACALALISCVFGALILRRSGAGGKPSAPAEGLDRAKGEIVSAVRYTQEGTARLLDAASRMQREKLEDVERRAADQNKIVDYRLAELKKALEDNLRYLSEQNARALREMRQTVDEKLSETLEKRLNDSFTLIGERLEAVYKGIGEVQNLAQGVGDLKKVFSNVRMRGTWGETQLNLLLSEMLSSDQFVKNFALNPETDERVDFAVVLPGKRDGDKVFLPIDSKFPVEEYQRLLDAYDAGDAARLEKAAKGLTQRIKDEADKISSKYVLPPKTTDFAIMYFPLEGLYAEALRRDDLTEYLRKKRVMLCGPTNLGALLNSLQTGFKTLAIEKRSSELWQLLSAFKLEFSRFADLLVKTQKKLIEAQDTIDSAAKKTRQIERKLAGVKEIGESEADALLGE